MGQKQDRKNQEARAPKAQREPGAPETTFLRDLLEENPAPILGLSAQGVILFANRVVAHWLGYAQEALQGMDFLSLLDASSRATFQAVTARLRAGRRVAPVELALLDALGHPKTAQVHVNCRLQDGEISWFRVTLQEYIQAAVEPPAEHPRILVVEDDPVSARLLQRLLEQGGYDTDRAASAAEALGMLEQRYYDAMTLDLMLPDRDGLDLLRDIRADADTADLPVIVVSASADQAREHLTGDAAHVVDWLNKPLSAHTLRQTLARAVRLAPGELPQVLHVEGDNDFYEQVGRTLTDIALIDRAGTLAQARRLLQENDDYDLVLLGLMLPDGFGAELLPFLNRPRGRSVPVILVSADEAGEALSSHVVDTLNKSHTTQQQMLETIRAHLRPPPEAGASR